MKQKRFLMITLFVLTACVPGFSLQCPYKECECFDTSIYCSNQGLQEMPPLISSQTSNFTSFSLQNTQVTTIPAGSVPANLSSIYLMVNPLMTIDDGAFDESAKTLVSLTIQDAPLSRIPGTLLKLRNLQGLTISRVPIQDWNIDAMKNIGSTLEMLTIDGIDLTTSPPTWLQYFSRLTQLLIINSNLTSLTDNALEPSAKSLTSLSLYNNSLTSAPKALSKLQVLESLSLSFNRISSVEWLPQSTHLMSLALDRNRISNSTQLSNVLKPFGDSLISCYIQVNELTSVPDLSFLTHIGDFDFSYNKIYNPDSGSLPSTAHSLDLQYNNLPAIPRIMSKLTAVTDVLLHFNVIKKINGTDFPPNTISVYLESNLITELSDTSFPQNSSIKSVYLDNNPITKVTLSSFTNLRRLQILSLRSTKLVRLPLALSSLVSLNSLDVSDTVRLICTCQEKVLEHWILSVGFGNVLGQCGSVSVYDFFATLSPECPVE